MGGTYPTSPEADLPVWDNRHSLFQWQSKSDSKANGLREHEIFALGLFLENEIDRLLRKQAYSIDLASERYGGHDAIQRSCISVTIDSS